MCWDAATLSVNYKLSGQHTFLAGYNFVCSVVDCNNMWNVWHGSKLEKCLFRNKPEEQPLLDSHQGKAVLLAPVLQQNVW